MKARTSLLLAAACLIFPSLGSAQIVEYYSLDAIGNVRVVTDQQGKVIERHDYLPFGEECVTGPCASNPEFGVGEPRKFTGKERDTESGLDYFGARYYGSKIGRFTTTDPAFTTAENLVDPQRWNKYAYGRNNPLRYVDPDGRELRTTAQDTINAIAGDAAGRVVIRNGVVDTSGLRAADLSGNEGASLLNQLATSNNVYSYGEGSIIQSAAGPQTLTSATRNLDNAYDPRYDYKGGKTSSEVPPAGVDASVVVNPTVVMVDRATGKNVVSPHAIAFHELAEAYGRVDRGQSYGEAHAGSAARERALVQQRPGFTQGLAGDPVKKSDQR